MICYSLRQDISLEKLQKDLNRMISKISEPHDTLMLYIDIRKISYDDNSLIPKIEYKGDADCPT